MGMLPDSFGYLHWRIIADDIAPVDIQTALAIANSRRIIYGFVWYYHASADVAARTMKATLRNLGLAMPTGFTEGFNSTIWGTATVTLTADEEGLIYVMAPNARDGFSMSADDGTAASANSASAPQPFPLLISQEDLAEIFWNVGSAHANDRHSIYILEEEWIEE